jgi:amino acid transporter
VPAAGGAGTTTSGAGDTGGIKPRSQLRELLALLRDAIRDIFVAALVVYLVLLMLEWVKRGFASFFFNMDILLAVVLVTGIIALITGGASKVDDASRPVPWPRPVVFLGACALGVAGMVIIYFGTSATGGVLFWSLVTGGILIVVLTMLLLFNGEKTERGQEN